MILCLGYSNVFSLIYFWDIVYHPAISRSIRRGRSSISAVAGIIDSIGVEPQDFASCKLFCSYRHPRCKELNIQANKPSCPVLDIYQPLLSC